MKTGFSNYFCLDELHSVTQKFVLIMKTPLIYKSYERNLRHRGHIFTNSIS